MTYQATRCHSPEGHKYDINRRENLEFHMLKHEIKVIKPTA